MEGSQGSTENDEEPRRYEIRVKGHLDSRWGERFEGLSFTRDSNGTTVLRGPVADQAALHGLLRNIRDLGLPLISVVGVSSERSNEPEGTTRIASTLMKEETNR
ncbi:hypothetical protein SAMN05216312_110197 [Cohnella sp. OV330]|uniref:hypothetical protein n=1 Tax=Cohnella sp. OV330 TaxID=1855288 RepID=UPI0008E0A03D|nr:hypothetical protein [Cohnella sp. OV330]SFB50184.1 hypothetical protein SAMN05216312_110197 [Cohnella sp. OV330]